MKGSIAVFCILMLGIVLYREFIWQDPGLNAQVENPIQDQVVASYELEKTEPTIETKVPELRHEGLDEYQTLDSKKEETLNAEQIALLNHPKVEHYFKLQENKKRLSDYFNSEDSQLEPAEVWQLIEDIEEQGRVIAFEALTMKLAWLEKNTASEIEFKEKSKQLIESYREKSLASAKAYDPETIPGFTEYKAAEVEIIKEVNAMQTYPDGMTKQDYLRQRLLEARVAAYGS